MFQKTIVSLSIGAMALLSASMLPIATPTAEANALSIYPLAECRIVLLQDNGSGTGVPTGMWRGVWGYWNQNTYTVDPSVQPGIEAGGNRNFFKVGTTQTGVYDPAQANKGQVSTFLPGRNQTVFSADYVAHSTLVWNVVYPTTLRSAGTNGNTQICDATKTRKFVPQSDWYLYGV